MLIASPLLPAGTALQDPGFVDVFRSARSHPSSFSQADHINLLASTTTQRPESHACLHYTPSALEVYQVGCLLPVEHKLGAHCSFTFVTLICLRSLPTVCFPSGTRTEAHPPSTSPVSTAEGYRLAAFVSVQAHRPPIFFNTQVRHTSNRPETGPGMAD
jgi:hypothetical protein